MKVIGIVGSKRKNGNTSYLVQETLEEVKKQGIETELIFLGDYVIKDCTGCEGCKDTYECVINDDMQKIYPLLLEADAVIIGSPTYFYNVTADMKAFLDRCYCFEVFADDDRSVWMGIHEVFGGKYAVVIAVCEQFDEKDMGFTAKAMSKTFEALGYRVIETVKTIGAFKAGEVSECETSLQQARKAGKRLIKTLKLRNKTKTELINKGILKY